MTSEIEYKCNNCGHEGLNTRAVPDAPELVRYSAVKRYGRDEVIEKNEHGEYVRYDQAAAIIAAKDAEIQELKENLGVVSTERHADAEYIEHLQAELAQIKAQEPVARQWKCSTNNGSTSWKNMDHPNLQTCLDFEEKKIGNAKVFYRNLYAALSGKEPS